MSHTKFEQGQTVVVLGPPKDWDNDVLYWNKRWRNTLGNSTKSETLFVKVRKCD